MLKFTDNLLRIDKKPVPGRIWWNGVHKHTGFPGTHKISLRLCNIEDDTLLLCNLLIFSAPASVITNMFQNLNKFVADDAYFK